MNSKYVNINVCLKIDKYIPKFSDISNFISVSFVRGSGVLKPLSACFSLFPFNQLIILTNKITNELTPWSRAPSLGNC
jgi:hypothetical protein